MNLFFSWKVKLIWWWHGRNTGSLPIWFWGKQVSVGILWLFRFLFHQHPLLVALDHFHWGSILWWSQRGCPCLPKWPQFPSWLKFRLVSRPTQRSAGISFSLALSPERPAVVLVTSQESCWFWGFPGGEMVLDTHRQGIWPSSGLLGTDDSRKVSKMGVLKRLSFSFPPQNH